MPAVVAHGAAGSTETFNAAAGTVHTATLDANLTATFSGATAGVQARMTLELTQDATGGRTVTWPASVRWPSGATPVLTTTAASLAVLVFTSVDGGTSWLGFLVADNLVVPTVPGAPTIGTATAGNASATVTWTAPASNGGSAITGYTVTPYIAGVAQTPTTVGVILTTVITSLTNGTAHTFKVAAINAIGTGSQSGASNSVTPSAGPTELLDTAAVNQETTLRWGATINTTPALSTAQFHGGAQSVECAAIAGGQIGTELDTPWVTIVAGTTYTGKIWLRTDESGLSPELYIRYANLGVNHFLGDFSVSAGITVNTWQQYTISGLAPATANRVRLFVTVFGMTAGKKLWLDDASVT